MFARIIIAVSLLSTVAAAQPTLTPGSAGASVARHVALTPVHKTTAERLIIERGLVCTYGKTRFESTPDGRLVIIMGKVCTERPRDVLGASR